ncbi:MAG: response regulator transcription factor [Bacteroidetes bacterium]|nr:response regulator transcription factor [Bacteroidota bacterium]
MIGIFEDHPDLREALVQLIGQTDDLECAGAWEHCAVIPAAVRSCNVIVMDIGLPGRSGIEGVREIKTRYPSVEVVMLTVHEDEQKIFDAIRAGASGYLLKRTEPAGILDAIREIRTGGANMTGSVARKVLSLLQRDHRRQSEEFGLSERERQVLQSLVKGFSYKLIAEEYFISIDTVRSHIKKIYEKLHVHSKSEAVAKAMKSNIL